MVESIVRRLNGVKDRFTKMAKELPDLNRSVYRFRKDLPDLNPEQLRALLKLERMGQGRVGVLTAIMDLINQPPVAKVTAVPMPLVLSAVKKSAPRLESKTDVTIMGLNLKVVPTLVSWT